MTLKEIAKEAGVSISTVSRVINKSSTNAASKEV
ncbi:MAG: LacI family DNA-binding transcriptional regulator, partial [Clostridium sp.]|nr:LacI family DNA-binding transcriptional regulator [Clostridium sp.]